MIALPPAPPVMATATTAAPITIPDLVEMTSLSSLAISPDGKWVAFRTERNSLARNRLEIKWYVAPVDGSAPARLIGDGGQALYDSAGTVPPEAPIWSPASNAIFYRALIEGEIQVWRAPLDGGSATMLTTDPGNVRTLVLGSDGGSLAYTVDATRAAIEQAERDAFDEGTPGDGSAELTEPASRGSYIDGRFLSRRSVRDWAAYSHLLWRTPTRTVTIKLPGSDRNKGSPATALFAPVKFTPRWEAARKHWRLVVTPSDGVSIACTAKLCDERSPIAVTQLPGRQDYVVTLRNTALDDALAVWTPHDQSIRVIKQATGMLTSGSDYTRYCVGTKEAFICVAEGAVSPPSIVRISFGDGATQTLFAPNAALAERVTTPVRLLEWRDHKGFEHSGQLILPTSPKPPAGYPLVFTYYACDGFMRGGTGDELPLIPLAQTGVAALCITRARSDLTHQDSRADQRQAFEDIKTVTDQLVGQGLVDRRRIGEWGYSFGSEVMSQILIHTNLLAAAASASDLIDPPTYWFDSLPGRTYPNYMRSAWHLGEPSQDRAGWRQVAPAFNIDKIHAPILFQMPEREARTTIELWSTLSASLVPTELWMFANEYHTKFFPRHIAVSMSRNMDWFRYWLDGQRDPDPAKIGQYERWDALDRRWSSNPHSTGRASP